jgi:hypothetical protein
MRLFTTDRRYFQLFILRNGGLAAYLCKETYLSTNRGFKQP